jgi:hypothetical protein
MNLIASTLLLPCLDAGNKIGADGAKALADALKPQKNPDNSWCHNQALQKLDLSSDASPLLFHYSSL